MADLPDLLATRISFSQAYNSTSDAVRIGTSKSKFRDEFLTFDTVNNWTIVQQAPGAAAPSVDGLLNGARYLKIPAGTVSGEETILISKQTFRGPVKVALGLSLSQRIANQEFYVELVEVDDEGNVVNDASFTATKSRQARNCAGIMFDGAVATTANYVIRGQGVSELVQTAVTTLTTLATGTTPNFMAAAQFEFLLQTDVLNMACRPVNSAAAATVIANRTDYVPNTDPRYAIRIRTKNLATVTATDFRIHFVRVLDAARLSVDFGVIGGVSSSAMAAPVNVVSGSVSFTNSTLAVTTTPTTAGSVQYVDSITNLAISATLTGASRDATATPTARKFIAYFAGSQASATDGCKIQHSTDGTTWYDSVTDTKVAGKTLRLEADVVGRYYRTIMINGTVAQTGMGVHSVFTKV